MYQLQNVNGKSKYDNNYFFTPGKSIDTVLYSNGCIIPKDATLIVARALMTNFLTRVDCADHVDPIDPVTPGHIPCQR